MVCYTSVQRHGQCALSVQSFCGGYRGFFPRQHNAQKGWPDKKGQRQALVGQIQVLQDWHKKWGILLPAFQSEQVFPICVILATPWRQRFILLVLEFCFLLFHLKLCLEGGCCCNMNFLLSYVPSYIRNEVQIVWPFWWSLEQQLFSF